MDFKTFLLSNKLNSLMHFAGGLRGASIIDSLDTLYIMGLMEEYNDAKEWVQTSLDLNSVRNSFFSSRWTVFIIYFLCCNYFKVSVQLMGNRCINIMKFSAAALRAASILSRAIVLQHQHCVHWVWQFSKARDTPAGIKSFLCGHRTRRVTDWWDSLPLWKVSVGQKMW